MSLMTVLLISMCSSRARSARALFLMLFRIRGGIKYYYTATRTIQVTVLTV